MFIKGRSAIRIARVYLGQGKNYGGMHFWSRRYFALTVGPDEEPAKAYIQRQESEYKRLD
jgi:putative transposase